MASLIQIKRSSTSAFPPGLANGELAYTSNGDVLWIGTPGGAANDMIAIGGARVPGVLTANQALVANSTSGINQVIMGQMTLNGSTITTVNAVANDTTLGAATNNEITTTWAIKTYVDARVANSGTASQLNDLSDVTLGGLANNDILVYDASTGDFENHTISGTANEVEVNFAAQNLTIGLPSDVTITTSLTIGTSVVKANNGILFDSNGLFADGANGIIVDASGINVEAGTGVTVNNSGVHIGQAVNTTSDVTFRDITATGNLVVSGTLTTVDTVNLVVNDPLIKLARNNNTTDVIDVGLYGLYDTSGSLDLYGGLFRDATDGKWKLFVDLQVEPTTTVNTGGAGYTPGTLVANIESASVAITGGSITGITDLAVADGGTGVSTFTTNGILYGQGASAIAVTAAGNDGEVLQSVSGVPQFGTLDGGTF